MHYFDYSLSLIPTEEYAEIIRTLSRQLKLDFGDFQPHVTLLPLDRPVDIHEPQTIELTAAGYYCNIGSQRKVWHGLKLEYSASLINLRHEMADRYGIDIREQAPYFPHITLGCTGLEGLSRISLSPLQGLNEINNRELYILKVCRNGDYGKVIQVL